MNVIRLANDLNVSNNISVFGTNELILDMSNFERNIVYEVTQDNSVVVIREEAGIEYINGYLPMGSFVGLLDIHAPIKYKSTVNNLQLISYERVDLDETRPNTNYKDIQQDDIQCAMIQLIPGFAHKSVKPEYIKESLLAFEVREYQPRGKIIVEGEKDNNLYYLMSGLAHVVVKGSVVRVLTPCTSVFGESPFLTNFSLLNSQTTPEGQRRNADVVASMKSDILIIDVYQLYLSLRKYKTESSDPYKAIKDYMLERFNALEILRLSREGKMSPSIVQSTS